MKKYLVIILVFSATFACSQQDPMFTQYMFNKLVINPAYAGTRDALNVELLGRFQWVGIEGAPQTISFSANSPLKNRHLGLGVFTFRDQLGPEVNWEAMGVFSYKVLFPTTTLSFGVAAGINYYDIDWTLLNPKDLNDLELNSQVSRKVTPDIDFGIYYYGKKFYIGLSSRHLLQNKTVMYEAPDGTSNFTKLLAHFYGITGAVITLSDDLDLLPSIMVKYAPHSPVQGDFNLGLMMFDVLEIGATYRTENAFAFLVEVNITQSLSIGYSYDVWTNSLKQYNKGSHEIRVGYDLNLFDKTRMLTPRYF